MKRHHFFPYFTILKWGIAEQEVENEVKKNIFVVNNQRGRNRDQLCFCLFAGSGTKCI